MRGILEVEVAGLAAERAGLGDVEEMRIQVEKMRGSIDAPEGYVDADVEFHALLARAAQNGVLLTMLEPVVDLLRASRQDRKSTRLNSSHANISYAVFCLKKKKPPRPDLQSLSLGHLH